jgi:hypothetical protein
MNINIGQYRVTSDSRNVSVHKVSIIPEADEKGNPNKRAGDERLDFVGHYGNAEQAFTAILQNDIMIDEAVSIDELIDVIKSSEKRIVSAVKG